MIIHGATVYANACLNMAEMDWIKSKRERWSDLEEQSSHKEQASGVPVDLLRNFVTIQLCPWASLSYCTHRR